MGGQSFSVWHQQNQKVNLVTFADAAAKAQLRDLLRSFGWKEIIDLGDISTARGVERYLTLWLRLWGALGTGMLNVRVVR